jgi:subtilase family serine protease
MRTSKVLSVLAAVAFLVSIAAAAENAPSRRSVSPFLKVGPQAVQMNAVGSNYGLFTCQVGLSAATCYDPYQVRHAYNVDNLINAGFDGKGKTIVIVDAFQDPYLVSDLNYLNTFYGLPSLNGLGGASNPSLGSFSVVAPDGLTAFDPTNNTMVGWAEEITLDVEYAHAMAPGANIVLVLAKTSNDTDILSATKYAVDNNLGDVISQSFGENESCVDPTLMTQQHELFAEATRKHITLFASAGDNGATQLNCDGTAYVKAASSPAVDPLVTAVGGTELHAASYCLTALGCDPTTNPAAGTYEGEIVWNESAIGGGATGGGFSLVYNEPPYQQGTIHGGKQRGEPDVSYNAAVEHGVLVRLFGSWYLFGGTSAGSPQWAAITAIADEYSGYDLGFINTALYHLSHSPTTYTEAFYDVTSGDNSWAGITGYSAGPGWDPTTGLGSPKADAVTVLLKQFVSAGDGTAAIATTKPHPTGKAGSKGHVLPH